MRPDPSTIARLLALPIEARRRLAEQPGPGWLIFAFEGRISIELRTRPPAHMDPECESWYPADSAVWMRAAAGERRWVIHRGGAMITGQEDSYPTAEECALSWFEAGN